MNEREICHADRNADGRGGWLRRRIRFLTRGLAGAPLSRFPSLACFDLLPAFETLAAFELFLTLDFFPAFELLPPFDLLMIDRTNHLWLREFSVRDAIERGNGNWNADMGTPVRSFHRDGGSCRRPASGSAI